jgi:hypothetical protein
MAIRFKVSNSPLYDGRIAYAELRGRHACEVGQGGWIHFGQASLTQAREAADARDPIVIYQELPGVRRVITHVVLPTGEVAENFLPENRHPHQIAVRVLARMKLSLLAPVPHPDGIGRTATRVPAKARVINDVLWREGRRVDSDFYAQLGSPFRRYGSASVEAKPLLEVLNNGHFELTPDAIDVLKAASEAGLNH